MKPREIYEEIFLRGPRLNQAVKELAELVEKISRGPVVTRGGKGILLPEEERRALLSPTWNRALGRFARGLEGEQTDESIQFFIKKIAYSVVADIRKKDRDHHARYVPLDDIGPEESSDEEHAAPSRQMEHAESDASSARPSYLDEALLLVEPIAREYIARSRRADRKRIGVVWKDIKARLDGSSMRQVLESHGLVDASTPPHAFRKLRQAYYMRHIRLREGLARTVDQLEGEGRLHRSRADLIRRVLHVLVRTHSANGAVEGAEE